MVLKLIQVVLKRENTHFSVHRANGTGLSARCARPFFLSPKIHLKGHQLPAGRGIFQISFLFCITGKEIFGIRRGRKISSLIHYYTWQGAKWPGSQTGNKKKQQIFFRLTAFAVRRWRLVFSFESSGQVSSTNFTLSV